MGYTIGDVLTVIGFVFGILFAIWALMVCFALIFPVKAENARREVHMRPWRAFLVGVAFNAVATAFGTILLSVPNPLIKLVGWGVYVAQLGVMCVGASGLALLAGNRIQQLDRRRGGYRALERGAMLLVVGAVLPIFGWFGFAPVIFAIAGGAGFRALFFRNRATESLGVFQETHGKATAGEFVV